jgi:hypothetical protein
MHRTRTDSSRCQLQGTQDEFATVLVSLLGPLMLPTTVLVAFLETTAPGSTRYAPLLPASWIVPPEPPPPRS